MKPAISVIIPVYNIEAYIEECLSSVFQQTYPDLEIIAVNDGSTDRSRELLQACAASDSRLVILDKENGGLSDARNHGLSAAHGDYVMFVDGDDRIRCDAAELLFRVCTENDADIAVSDMEYFYEDGERSFSSGGVFRVTDAAAMPSLVSINNSACNKLFRRSLFDDLRFPVGKYYEDLATVPVLLYKAERVAKVDEPLYEYRQRRGSIAHTASRKIFDIYDALDGDIAYVREHGNEPEVLKALYSLYIVHGLDLTTLRIKDFDDRNIRGEYLLENMTRLKRSYPDYRKDEAYRTAGWKKKLIWGMLEKGRTERVLKIYDR
ncbi:MAG: glycosyltransferase [Solobacterium sp.]|nr:glycosyltransferase [Solobacterium sp.]